MSLTVRCFPYGPLGENTYVVKDQATGQAAVIDPGYYGADAAEEIGGRLSFILLTHGHFDHFAAARRYMQAYPDAEFVAPAGDTRLMYRSTDNKWFAGGDAAAAACPEAGLLVREGDTITLGETVFTVIETPGHTEGGICYLTDSDVFTGDTLFRLSVGNTSFETGDWDTMVRSIETKLYTLDESMTVWPGHGEKTTIGFEKRANPFV